MATNRRELAALLAGTTVTAVAAPPSGDEAGIRAVLGAQEAAWNRGDIPAFMQAYEDSAETAFVGAAGVTRGFAPVLENYRKRYPTREAMGRLTYSGIEVHPLGGDHAWVLGRFHLARNAAGGGDKGGIYTLLFKKSAAGWKIVLDHTS